MIELPGAYQAARREWVQLGHLPRLPGWWPLPDPDKPLTPPERAAARVEQAMREARRGPMDGQRIGVAVGADGRPPQLLRLFDGGWAYRLDPADSSPDWLVYRYSPADSPQHANTMATVVEAYVERGPEVVAAARLQQPETASLTGLDAYSDPEHHRPTGG